MKIKNYIAIFILAFISILSTSVFAVGNLPATASTKKVDIYINNEIKLLPENYGRAYFDKSNNRVMVPIRYITEQFGAYIQFYTEPNSKKQGILIGGVGNKLIKMNIGENNATFYEDKDNQVVTTDAPAVLYDGRTYVPIRFISEAMGLKVKWENNCVYIEGSLNENMSTNNSNNNIKSPTTSYKYTEEQKSTDDNNKDAELVNNEGLNLFE